MAKKRLKKSVIYKQCELGPYGSHLQDLVDQAFKLKSKAVERREELGDNGEEVVRRVVSKIRRQDGMLFGQLLLYQVGKDMTFVVEDESAEDFEIESSNPPASEDGKRREVLESALYFALLGNHVVIQQSQALKARDLEKHLNWLLRGCTEILSEKYSVCLSDKPSDAAREKIESMPVKAACVGTPLVAEESKYSQGSGQTSTKFLPTGNGFAVLKAIFGESWTEQLSLDDALDDANLEVRLQVRYKRKTSKSGEKFLAQLGRAFRHFEPEDSVIETVGGPSIHGKDLKLTGHFYVDTYNGVVDCEDLYKKMHTWLETRIKEGTVVS